MLKIGDVALVVSDWVSDAPGHQIHPAEGVGAHDTGHEELVFGGAGPAELIV